VLFATAACWTALLPPPVALFFINLSLREKFYFLLLLVQKIKFLVGLLHENVIQRKEQRAIKHHQSERRHCRRNRQEVKEHGDQP
jgi:hypothetical protein